MRYRPVGILNNGVLRYCPMCYRHDIHEFGEPYWHRQHHLPGVDVCWKHATFLELTSFSANKVHTNVFYTPEMIGTLEKPKVLNLGIRSHQLLQKIAKEFDWLLNQKGFYIGNQALREKYAHTLAENGYTYPDGAIKTEKFLSDFAQFYSPEFLEAIRCPVNPTLPGSNWLLELAKPSRFSANPLFHMLMILFWSDSFEQFVCLG